jgi:hypothetical protein
MEIPKMKKAIGIIVIMAFVVLGCFLTAGLILAGIAIILAALKYSEVINMVFFGKGAEIAEKLTGEKYIR